MIAPSALLDSPAPAPHGAEPPGSPPGRPFSTVLDDHQARTAVAEGRQTKSETSTRRPADVRARDARDASDSQPSVREDDGAGTTDRADRDDACADAHDGDGAPPQAAATPAALAALLGGVPLPAGVATAIVAARLPVATAASPTAATATPAAGLPGAPAAAPPMPTGPAVPAAATALPLGPAAAAGTAPSAPALPSGLTAAAAGPAPRAPALPSGLTAVADALQAPAARPAAQQAPTVQAAPPAPTTAPVALPAAPPAGAQATAPADGAGIAGGVDLEHAVETVRLALSAAADRGVTHARISLNPRELGSIEVHLRQTADGLVARVVAQHAGAAQLLQNAGGDLRRALESQGLNLLRLDIGASGEQSGEAADRQALANGAAGDGPGGRGARGDDQGASDDALAALDPTTTTTTTLALANGALVDVLA